MILLLILAQLTIFAQANSIIDDSELNPNQFIKRNVSLNLFPSRSEILEDEQSKLEIILFYEDKNREEIIPLTLPLKLDCQAKKASISFNESFYEVRYQKPFVISGPFECNKKNKWFFDSQKDEGQVISLYKIISLTKTKLQEKNLLSFWKKKVSINWPGSGDYYNYNNVSITSAHYWDVVGHEIGHAIYDQAKIGQFGGGAHKIDECYSHALALSEGWASFFSAWLSIDPREPSAQFEYMVPRRAPLEIEHIPSDVCAGPKNEWRVTGFLWDLIDLNDDQENSKLSFEQLWKITLNGKFKTIMDLAQKLERSGMDPVLLNVVYENNFLERR